jgi:hypothetical protein
MNWLKKKLFNWAAESVGEIEDAIHHPLYGISDYTADVYYGYLTRGPGRRQRSWLSCAPPASRRSSIFARSAIRTKT